MTKRYAIYFTLAKSEPIYKLAADWLGYDAYSGKKAGSSTLINKIKNNKNKYREITSSASKYGFHATLKPPFRLQQGKTKKQLIKTLENFTSTKKSFSCSPLKLKSMGHFLALAPKNSCDQLDVFAEQCLKHFEPFRAELNSNEYNRRKQALLTERQLRYLEQWGYPYVKDEFRFHMTLTDSLPQAELINLKKRLKPLFKAVSDKPLNIDTIHLFQQDKPVGHFHIVSSHKFRK